MPAELFSLMTDINERKLYMKENFICVNICNGQSFYIKPMDFRLFGGFYSLHSVLFNPVKQLHTLILETKDTTIHEMAFNLFFLTKSVIKCQD